MGGHSYRVTLEPDNLFSDFELVLIDKDTTTVKVEDFYSPYLITWLPDSDADYYILIREGTLGDGFTLQVLDEGIDIDFGDFNQDGFIDSLDLMLFQNIWHTKTATTTPTP